MAFDIDRAVPDFDALSFGLRQLDTLRLSVKEGRAMFEIGRSYTIRMWEEGEDGGVLADYDNCEVVEISLPLVKFRQSSNEDVIVNTASLAFVQATLEAEAKSEE
ncbi:MAG TPA: hypothetical protein VKC66_07950 [Xanthobacteraceae bacterium]|nr:hypothetical protein [Xanthobacteraceae bacterium]